MHSRAKSRVQTGPSGSTTIKMHAHAPKSTTTSSVSVQVRAGSAPAQCSTQEPANKKQVQKKLTTPGPMLLLPPWDSAKLWSASMPTECRPNKLFPFVMYAKLCGYLCHVCQTVMAYALCKMPNSMALNIMCANNIVHAVTFAILTIYLRHKLEAYTYIPG